MQPDIIWILTTQWRGQACGYAGDPNARTPHLDALAWRSLNFAQAVTPHPFGPFARAAILTGVRSPANGVSDYFDPLPVEARTIAHQMNERGYATGFFGKWHLWKRDPAAPLVGEAHAKIIVPPEARGGFETWDGFESGFLLNDPWLHGWTSDTPEQHPGYQSDVVCARAARWLAETKRDGGAHRRPRFCIISLDAPHPPYAAPAAGVAPRDPAEIALATNVPRGGAAEAEARRELAGYHAHIEATDRALGRHVLPLAEDPHAVVVFTSVHGDMHGAHGQFRKGWPYDESVRVPLLISGVGKASERGVASPVPVSLVDLPRWTLTLAEDRMPFWGDESVEQGISMPSVVALPQQCDRVWRGLRTATRKIVLNADGSPWLFFDLANDPGEMHNLVDDPAWKRERLLWQRKALAIDR